MLGRQGTSPPIGVLNQRESAYAFARVAQALRNSAPSCRVEVKEDGDQLEQWEQARSASELACFAWRVMHHNIATQARSLVSDSVTALVDNQVCVRSA